MELTALEKALYLIERGYFPMETDPLELSKKIAAQDLANKNKPKKQITNDINTVYIDKTKN